MGSTPRFRQTIGVSNRKILGYPIRVVDQFPPGRFSRSRALMRSRSSLVTPARVPVSTS